MGADPAAEEQFGPYLVYERLGVGGMATVHRALERGAEGFERIVALKRLLPHLAEDASFIKSFVREAKLASLLNHVNIVQIYELGRVGTQYFISMEYIDGRDVRRVLRHARKVTGPPPIHISVAIMLQVCEALEYAHAKHDEHGHPMGLVHRDVSPSNLLITSTGHVKVIDFGIAKAQSSQLRTQTGRVKGKLAYMAPEAIHGKDLDSRSDLWAAGVILHELLTARPLFASKNEYQTLLKVQRGDILPPSTFNQGCPPELDAIVFKALARDPDERFSHAAELRDELAKVRRQYQLQTSVRDLAQWLDWAFTLESPGGFAGNTVEPSAIRQKTPKGPRNRDEDEAVEMVWGSGEHESGGPHILDDVPDVSEKHLAPRADTDDDDDDKPTPVPHARAFGPAVPRGSDPGLPPRAIDPALTRSTDSHKARGSGSIDPPRRSAPLRGPAEPDPSSPPPVQRPRGRDTAQGVTSKPIERAQRPSDRPLAPQPRPTPGRVPLEAKRTTPPPIKRPDSLATDPDGNPIVPTDPLAPRLKTDPTDRKQRISHDDLYGSDEPPTLAREDAVESVGQDDPTKALELPRPKSPSMQPVRFARQQAATPDPEAITLDGAAATRPGMPAAERLPGAPPPRDPLAEAALEDLRSKRDSEFQIGASMVARHKSGGKSWIVVLGILVAGVGATAITLFVTRGQTVKPATQSEPTQVVDRAAGTVKFVIEPGDAEVRIEGKASHSGSPWSTELAPGLHQIEIHHAGFKSWLTSVELSPHEIQTLRVVLEPLGGATNGGEATLSVTTNPPGLDAVLDGQVLPQRTPIKVTIKVGTHSIAVRQNGVEVWHQTVNAEASSDYEFNPVLTADKLRERAERQNQPPAEPAKAHDPPVKTEEAVIKDDKDDDVKSEPEPAEPKQDRTEPRSERTHGGAPKTPPLPAITAPAIAVPPPPPAPPPPPVPTKPAIATPAPVPAPPAANRAPVLVPPNAVTKLSGETPNITARADLPPVVAAKVCIDIDGRVTSADVITKLEHRASSDLADALRTWRYAPYAKTGSAQPACFVVTLRTK